MMISLKEAQTKILENIKSLDTFEDVHLSSSVGRVLSESIWAPFDQPPFTNAAMDGFAVRAEDVIKSCEATPVSLHIQKYQSAGSSFAKLEPGVAMEIATGAPMPDGADAVVMKEKVTVQDEKVSFAEPTGVGMHVRMQGENIAKGAPLFKSREKIREKHIGLLASFGVNKVTVVRKPRVSYLATGDEIVPIGEKKEAHQIYNSNAPSLEVSFKKEGCEYHNLGIVKDVREGLYQDIKSSLSRVCDILVLTGGVSVGKRDFVKEALEEVGATIIFHKVSMKPGKPILFAVYEKTLIFGLPGNPLSAQVGFYQFIYPAIQKLLNQRVYFMKEIEANLQGEVTKGKRHQFIVGMRKLVNNKISVMPIKEGSGSVAALARGNCFISVAEGEGKIENQSHVWIQSYS